MYKSIHDIILSTIYAIVTVLKSRGSLNSIQSKVNMCVCMYSKFREKLYIHR